jgi:DNA-binding YbaB/EbfC family protein
VFEKLAQFATLMQHLPKIAAEVTRLKERLAPIVVEGDAGGGMVKVRCNAKLEILSCTISEDVFGQHDREFLEDLILAATNQALERARQVVGEETAKVFQSLGLPPGMSMPDGLSLPGLS